MKAISLSAFLIENLEFKGGQATIRLRSKTLSFLPSAFYFPAFLLPLQSFWAEGIGCGPKGLGNRTKNVKTNGCSSIGRVAVSKTVGWEFESLHPCKA